MLEKEKPKPKPKPKIYDYAISRDKTKVFCFESDDSYCTINGVSVLGKASPFYDEELQGATKKINAILEDVAKRNKNPDRQLSLINVKGQLLLVWTECGGIGSDADAEVLAEAFGLELECKEST